MMQEARNYNSPQVRTALGSRFKQVRMARGKTAASIAEAAGISEFELTMIESGIYENLTHEIVQSVAFNLGLAPKPETPKLETPKQETRKELEPVAKSKKKTGRGIKLTDEERAVREKQGQEIKAFRLKNGVMASQVERMLDMSLNSMSQLENRGAGLYPGRKKIIMEAIERLANDAKTKIPSQPQARVFTPEPVKPKPKGFSVLTEHKLTCGDYELTGVVSGDDFSISIANQKEIMILEGQRKDKSGMLAALKYMINILEGG